MLNRWRKKSISMNRIAAPESTNVKGRGSVSIPVNRNNSKVPEYQARRSTISTLSTSKSKSIGTLNTLLGSQEHIHNLAKHYRRRPALISGGSESDEESSTSGQGSFIAVSVDSNNMDTIPIPEGNNLGDILLTAFHRRNLFITLENLSKYSIFAFRNGLPLEVSLNNPAINYQASVVRLKLPEENTSNESSDFYSCGSSDSPTTVTVGSCLQFFDEHGLRDLPSCSHTNDDYPPPKVQSIGILQDSCWEELPIDQKLKQSLSPNEHSQQQALWELIATEHSHLRQLEVVINLFMRTLELIRRAELLSDVNYHNIFGYMEDIYAAHLSFWNLSLQPIVEKVHSNHGLLDLNSFIATFPTHFGQHFDIYEHHCQFEQINLQSLDEAMRRQDFRLYLEWCEAQPECNRLRLKDYLAKPMQRLTKYSLLLSRILHKTLLPQQAEQLEEIVSMVSEFVDSVNSVLQVQEETSRVEEVMTKIIGYAAVDVASDFKELVQPYTRLDLMTPMPNVEISKPRFLMLEGQLRFRDHHSKVSVYTFLFTDMLLVTKPIRRSGKYIIIRPPYRVSSLQINLREQGLICCVVVNEFNVASDFFTLKAQSVTTAQVWVEQIELAKELYTSLIEQKAQSWQLLQSLRRERVVDGSQDFLDSASSLRRSSCQSVSGSSFADVWDNTLEHPTRQRSNTLPQNYFVPPSSTISADDFRFSSAATPAVKWKRVGSLNTLAERHYNASSLLAMENYNCHPLPRGSYEILSSAGHHIATQTDPCDTVPLPSQDLASCPLDDDSQSTVDEADISSCGSIFSLSISSQPNQQDNLDAESCSHYFSSGRQHSLSMGYHKQSSPTHGEDKWANPQSDGNLTQSSLMSEIMTELVESRNSDSLMVADFYGNNDFISDSLSLDYGTPSSPTESRHQRTARSKLEWIHEIMNEEDGNCPSSSLFARNSNLRKSKSSMELSMYRRSRGNKHFNYPTSGIREFYPSQSPLSPSPIQEAEEETVSPPSSPSKAQASFLRFKKKLSFKTQQRSSSLRERQERSKKVTKGRVKSAGASHSSSQGRWNLISIIRNKWRSTESGLNKEEPQELKEGQRHRNKENKWQSSESGLNKKDPQLSTESEGHEDEEHLLVQHAIRGSPRTMRVLRSPSQRSHNLTAHRKPINPQQNTHYP